jgi:hypothetical protein
MPRSSLRAKDRPETDLTLSDPRGSLRDPAEWKGLRHRGCSYREPRQSYGPWQWVSAGEGGRAAERPPAPGKGSPGKSYVNFAVTVPVPATVTNVEAAEVVLIVPVPAVSLHEVKFAPLVFSEFNVTTSPIQ